MQAKQKTIPASVAVAEGVLWLRRGAVRTDGNNRELLQAVAKFLELFIPELETTEQQGKTSGGE